MKKLWLFALCVACGGEAAREVHDARIADPAPLAGVIDLLAPERVIEPGEDVMVCQWLDYQGEDVAISQLEDFQGPGGHHILILTTAKPRPHGTVADCSEAKDMADMRPLILPVELPDGHAVKLTKGAQFVFQFHYVNSLAKPLQVRDVARLHTVPMTSVRHWVAPFATNDALFEVAAKADKTVEFDCRSDEDLELVLVGGHMHESGTIFELHVGSSTSTLESVYLVDPWRPDFRDAPPISLFFDRPFPLPKGATMRTRCSWKNDTSEAMKFPHEMCSSFGYIRGRSTPYICDTGGLMAQ